MRKSRARVIDQISSVSDHVLFVSIFFVGMVGIVVFRLFTNIPSVIVLLIPLSLMGAYALIVWKTERYRLREDRAADNLYYLGFLFTVTTLMVALIRYGTADNPDVNQIIGDLGVGLVTTIVGLVGRIFFGQLRLDPEEIEEQTRLMLSDVAETTKARLFRTNEIIDDLHQHSIQIMRNANEAYKQTSDGLIASVEELSKRLNGIDVPEDLVTKKLDPVLLDIERSVARLVDRIEKVEIPEDLISRRIQRVLSHLEGAIYGVSKRIAEIQVDPELMNSAVQRVFEPLDDSMIKLQQTFDATVRSFEKMNARRDEIDKFADVAERLNKEKQNVTAWGITIAENERNLKDLNNDLTKTHDVLGTVVKSVERLGTEASKQQEVHTKAVEQLVVTMRQTQREIQELSKTTEVLSKEFAHAMRQLVDAANFQSSGSRIA